MDIVIKGRTRIPAQKPIWEAINAGGEEKKILEELGDAVVAMSFARSAKAARAALDAKIPPARIVDEGLGKGMEKVGKDFNEGRVFLPQIIGASRAMLAGLSVIAPAMEKPPGSLKGTVVMGSVQGDIHEIGKSVCCAMLRGAGYNVIDLGTDVSADRFIDAALEYRADVIGASALMTTTLVAQKELVRVMREDGVCFKTAVGGAPCSQEWCDEIGADGYSASAGEIVGLVERLANRDGGAKRRAKRDADPSQHARDRR